MRIEPFIPTLGSFPPLCTDTRVSCADVKETFSFRVQGKKFALFYQRRTNSSVVLLIIISHACLSSYVQKNCSPFFALVFFYSSHLRMSSQFTWAVSQANFSSSTFFWCHATERKSLHIITRLHSVIIYSHLYTHNEILCLMLKLVIDG